MNLKLTYLSNQPANHFRFSLLSFSKVVWLLSFVILVTACGGGSDSSTPSVPDENSAEYNDNSGSDEGSEEPLEDENPDADDDDTPDEGNGNEENTQEPEEQPSPPMTVTKRNNVNTVGQGETATIILDVQDADATFDVEYSISFNGGGMSAYATVVSDFAANTITLTAEIPDNITQIGTVDFSLTITDGAGTQVSLEHHLDVTNADAEPQLKQLRAYADGITTFLELNEETLFVERFAKLLLMANPGDGSYNAREIKGTFNATFQSPLRTTLLDSIVTANNLLNGYGDMDPLATEVEIQDFLAAQRENLQRYKETVTDSLEPILENLDGAIPPLPTDTVYISPEANTVSVFIGNPHLGQFIDEEWVYSEDYQFMNDISYPANSTCTAL